MSHSPDSDTDQDTVVGHERCPFTRRPSCSGIDGLLDIPNQLEPNYATADIARAASIAIQAIMEIPLDSLDRRIPVVEAHGHTILAFVHQFSGRRCQEGQSFQEAIQTLLQTRVLVRLYYLRRCLVKAECYSDSPTLCWVDVILANLDGFIQALLSHGVPHVESLPETLQISKRRQQLLVASQLPYDWLDLPNVLLSRYASPAAKRLCITLLFVALTLSPEMHGERDPWMLTQRVSLRSWREDMLTLQPSFVFSCLAGYIKNLPNPRSAECTERNSSQMAPLHSAMIVALYAHLDITLEHNRRGSLKSSFSSFLLPLLGDVILSDLAVSDGPLMSLEGEISVEQRIVIGCGNTISWIWSTWNDHRVLEFETTIITTAIWLIHAASPYLTNIGQDSATMEDGSTLIERNLEANPAASLFGMLHLMEWCCSQLTMRQDDLPMAYFECLFSATCCLVRLFTVHRGVLPDISVPEALATVLGTFSSLNLEPISLQITQKLLEVCTLVPPTTTRAAIESSHSFKDVLNEMISNLLMSLRSDSFTQYERDPIFTARLSTTLQLIALVFHSSKADILGSTAYSLLNELVRYPKFYPLSSRIKGQLFVCLACLRGGQADDSLHHHNAWDDRSLFKFGIRSEDIPSVSEMDSQRPLTVLLFGFNLEMATATAFASYICFVPELSFSDSLLIVETWMHLRNFLSLSLQGRDSLCAEMMGTIINMITIICYAMCHLLYLMDDPTRAVCLLSPIMVSLDELLKRTSEIAACQMLGQMISGSLNHALPNPPELQLQVTSVFLGPGHA